MSKILFKYEEVLIVVPFIFLFFSSNKRFEVVKSSRKTEVTSSIKDFNRLIEERYDLFSD